LKVLMVSLAALVAGPAAAAADAPLLKDLTAVILLLGQPCGQVISAKRRSSNEHFASCSNGIRYRVFIDAGGRAVAQKQ
jgi:hypothetical protein